MNQNSGGIFTKFILIGALVLLNAFFAASEIAILSVNRNRVHHLSSEGDKKAALLEKILEEPSKFLATIQVGITLAGFFASASAAVSISTTLAYTLTGLNIPFVSKIAYQISIIAVTIFLSYITLVLGELVPKRLALHNSQAIAMVAVKPILFVSKVTSPFVKILTFSTNMFVRLFGVDTDDIEEKVTEEEIRMMIDVGQENGVLDVTEKEMINGIFEFDNTLAREVMTPRTNLFAIDIDTPMEEVISQVIEEQYSRIPVYEGDIDNIIGILHMKDLFAHIRGEAVTLREILRHAYFVPETKNIDILFRELQKKNNHMAVLIDEYGGVSGIVTIEDLMEEIFGDISDEYDEEREDINKIDQNTYNVNGLAAIDEVNERLNIKLPTQNNDTIAGFVIDLLGNIPGEDEHPEARYQNILFKVEKVDDRRVEKILITVEK